MVVFLEFVKNNYLVFTIISAILILSLIGYIVENRKSRDFVFGKKKKNLIQARKDFIEINNLITELYKK